MLRYGHPRESGVDPMGVFEALDTNLAALGVFEVLNTEISTANGHLWGYYGCLLGLGYWHVGLHGCLQRLVRPCGRLH